MKVTIKVSKGCHCHDCNPLGFQEKSKCRRQLSKCAKDVIFLKCTLQVSNHSRNFICMKVICGNKITCKKSKGVFERVVCVRVVQQVKDPTKPTRSNRPEAQWVDLKSMVGRIRVCLSQEPNFWFGLRVQVL